MKRVLTLLCIFMLCSAFQCDNEPIDDELLTEEEVCEEIILTTTEASLAFSNANSQNVVELCGVYRDALEAQILVCGDEDENLQELINQLGDCSGDNNPDITCEMAIVEKNATEEAFNNSTDQNYTENCNAFKIALQNFLDVCGQNQEAQNQLDGLGNCILTTGETASGQISVTAGTLDIIFDEITVEEEDGILKVRGETSAVNNYTIYFEVEDEELGNNLINTTFILTLTSEFTPSTESMFPFTSDVINNIGNELEGTFSGLTSNANNADLNLTSGVFNIEY